MGGRPMGTIPESPWIEHGIHTEDSDWRVHVCPSLSKSGLGRAQDRQVFFFPTACGVKAAWANIHLRKKAKQPGVEFETGDGVRVSPDLIDGCVVCHPPAWIWYLDPWSWRMEPSQKGRAAERVVAEVLGNGYVPIRVPFCRYDMGLSSWRQVSHWRTGHDFVVTVRAERERRQGVYRLEVKADLPGSKHGLFLQLAERNPLKRH